MKNAGKETGSYNFFMKEIINIKDAPAPIGAYNQAVFAGNMLFVSGQIALHPETNELITSTIEEETRQVMKNLGAILKAAGLTFEDVVKTSIFISNMENFSRINTVYSEYFNEHTAPARETVEVANLPKYVHVEISLIAQKG